LTRLVSYAHIATSTRLRAPSLFISAPTWVFTVLRVMCSSSAISALVRPRATVSSFFLAFGERLDRLGRRGGSLQASQRGEQAAGDVG
jgi:hypothetical protein